MKHANIAFFIPHLGCPNRCSFCNQNSITGQGSAPSPIQIEEQLKQAAVHLRFPEETEVAFFGGSFTAVSWAYQQQLLEVASKAVKQYGLKGIRFSTRPDCLSSQQLERLLQYPITAIELGAQSMDNEVLKANSRGHTAEDTCQAAERIRKAGLELGLQMMVGLYQDTAEISRQTARKLADLHPDTVRIYPTVVLRHTQLASLWKQGLYQPMELEQAVELCADLLWFFQKQGIRVLKLGLHASQEVEKDMLAGIYHPAFRELCESRIYLKLARQVLHEHMRKSEILSVNPGEISKMVGQHRSNLQQLEQEFGCRLKVIGDCGLKPYEICLQDEEKN